MPPWVQICATNGDVYSALSAAQPGKSSLPAVAFLVLFTVTKELNPSLIAAGCGGRVHADSSGAGLFAGDARPAGSGLQCLRRTVPVMRATTLWSVSWTTAYILAYLLVRWPLMGRGFSWSFVASVELASEPGAPAPAL